MTHLIVKAKTVWHVQLRIICLSTHWHHCFLPHLYWRPSVSSITRLGQLCAWAQSTWPAVGTVPRRGQQKRAICDTRRPYQMIWSRLKPVFCWFGWICCAYDSLRCLDLEIWQFSYWRQMTTTTTDFIPCTYVWGNYSGFTLLVWPKVHV